jgi:hypothetical protein
MMVLLCLFLFSAVFFAVYYIASNLKKAELTGKIKNAVEKRKPRTFITTYFSVVVENLACTAERVKYKKFISFIERNGDILKLLGKKV